MQSMNNCQEWIAQLSRQQDLVSIDVPVDPVLELPEIHRRVIASGGPALLFNQVQGSSFPVVSNLFGTPQRVEQVLCQGKSSLENLVKWVQKSMPPTMKMLWQERSLIQSSLKTGLKERPSRRAAVLQNHQTEVDLMQLPLTHSWKEDGGGFFTQGMVYTEHLDTKQHNMGVYRMQRFNQRETGMHWQIDKGGGFHHFLAESRNQVLPVSVFLGGPPVLLIAAIAPLPENLGELLMASFLTGEKLSVTRLGEHRIVNEAEFALLGHVAPGVRRMEGPFGDHYGYYSLAHEFPVFQVSSVYHRKNAVFPITVVGKPRQEDFFIGDGLQELLSPLFPLVMPGVRDLWSYGETGYHALSAAVVAERYPRESMKHAFRILGEGQLSLTKFLIVLNDAIPLRDFKSVWTHLLERFQPETDLFIFPNLSMDTLDYSGPELNKGSKGVMVVSGDAVRQLPVTFDDPLPDELQEVAVYCPGCLVVSTHQALFKIQTLLDNPSIKRWPFIVLTDRSAHWVAASTERFLWSTFTRFDPARDIHSAAQEMMHGHIVRHGSLLLDARKSPGFPDELFVDPETSSIVDKRWLEYFPKGDVIMGETW